MNLIVLLSVYLIVLVNANDLPYLVSLKPSETFDTFLKYDLNFPKAQQIRAFVDKSFSIGSFKGFYGTFSTGLIERLKRCPMVYEITQDQTFKMQESTVQEMAPRHLARLSRRDKLTGKIPKYYYDEDCSGQGILAYVIDSGIDADNPEFEGRASIGLDLTGEGSEDYNGHGSHVAGIIGSQSYGVSKEVEIIGIKALDKEGGGSLSKIIGALEFAVQHRLRSDKPGVANLSLGAAKNSMLDKAIKAAVETGLVIVVAAGNSDTDACDTSPASSPEAITVGAIDDLYDTIATFSNWGPCVDIFASGVFVASIDSKNQNNAQYLSGTSMAAPVVSGLVANLLSQGVPPAKIKEKVIEMSTRGSISRLSLLFKRKTHNRMAFNGYSSDDE